MRFERIRKDDSFKEVERKLQIYGYPFQAYWEFIFFILMEDLIFDTEKRKGIRAQIRRLKTLRDSIPTRLFDIHTKILSIRAEMEQYKIEDHFKQHMDIFHGLFGLEEFLKAIDTYVYFEDLKYLPKSPTKRRPQTADYIIGAVLSLIIRNRRAARWLDIYEVLRFFNEYMEFLGADCSKLHLIGGYTQIQLEDGSKDIKKRYPKYIEEKRMMFFPLPYEPFSKRLTEYRL